MFGIQFKIIVRDFLKSKTNTFINVFCLTIGLVASVFIFQYAFNEMNYDKYLEESSNVYRLKLQTFNNGKLTSETVAGCGSIGNAMIKNIPEVESFVRLKKINSRLVVRNEVSFKEPNMFYSTSSFFEIFPYKILKCSNHKLLVRPNHVVITEKTAKKYFNNEDPIDKVIRINNRVDYIVEGVCENPPNNTHFNFDFLVSWSTWDYLNASDYGIAEINESNLWGWKGFYTYVKLNSNANPDNIISKLPSLVERYFGETMAVLNTKDVYDLQSLEDIYLDSNYSQEIKANSNRKLIYFLIFIAVAILIMAWLNYINLSISKSIEKAKEIGVKKAFGIKRTAIWSHFIQETLIINFIAIIFASIILFLFKQYGSELIGKQTNFTYLFHNGYWYLIIVGYICFSIFLGFITGLLMSSNQAIMLLKGKLNDKLQSGNLRRSLVLIQFVVSLTLIASTMLMNRQLKYIQNADKNFNTENIVVLPTPIATDSLHASKIQTFREEVKRILPLESLSVSTNVPGLEQKMRASGVNIIGNNQGNNIIANILFTDYDFQNVYKLKLLEGRFFNNDFGNNRECAIINETCMKLLGYNSFDDVINKRISFWGSNYNVIGVVDNYNYESLKEEIEPLIIGFDPNFYRFFSLKFGSGSMSHKLIEELKVIWQKQFPLMPFDYFYVDEIFNELYQSEIRFGQVVFVFSILAIIIACLGLYGTVSFLAMKRVKEVGIRKTLGASEIQVVNLFLIDDLKLITTAIIISVPLWYYLMSNWLNTFAYRTEIDWIIIILSSLVSIVVTLLTVGSILYKAAKSNPTVSLRSE